MAVQTSYSERIAGGYAGQVADESSHDIATYTCQDSTLGFGLAVTKGTADDAVTKGGAVAGFRGVTVRDCTVRVGSTGNEFAQYDDVGVLWRGDIFVTTKAAVAAGGDVYYDSSTGLWDDASGGNVGPVKGAVWVTSAGSGELAILRLTGSQHDN